MIWTMYMTASTISLELSMTSMNCDFLSAKLNSTKTFTRFKNG
jgi:hypothetical protein